MGILFSYQLLIFDEFLANDFNRKARKDFFITYLHKSKVRKALSIQALRTLLYNILSML